MSVLDMFDLTGKVALVTSGAGLCGRQIVEALAEAGAKTYMASRNVDNLEEHAAKFHEFGLDVTACQLDQGDEASVLTLRNRLLKEAGEIHILVNNAVLRPMADWSAPADRSARSMQVNATGVFLMTRTFGQHMAEHGSGSIINVGSIHGMVGPDYMLYEGLAVNSDPATSTTCDTTYYAMQGPNYNVWGLVDDTGAIVERYAYRPYGQRQVYTSSGTNDPDCYTPIRMSQRVEISGVAQPYGLCPFGHQGLMHDQAIGLIYNRAREYNPTFGRFMQRDPLGYVDGMSLYQYVGSEPVENTDAWGRATIHVPGNNQGSPNLGFALMDFLSGAGDTYYFDAPNITAIRVLTSKATDRAWKEYASANKLCPCPHDANPVPGKKTGSCSNGYCWWYGHYQYTVHAKQYLNDIGTIIGDTPLGSWWGRTSSDDIGVNMLGSVTVSYQIGIRCHPYKKWMYLVVYNKWSVASLTRNPYYRKWSLTKKNYLKPVNLYFRGYTYETKYVDHGLYMP